MALTNQPARFLSEISSEQLCLEVVVVLLYGNDLYDTPERNDCDVKVYG